MHKNRSGKSDNTIAIIAILVVVGLFIGWSQGYIGKPVVDPVTPVDVITPDSCVNTATTTISMRARNTENTTGEDFVASSVYVLQDTGRGFVDVAGPVATGTNSTYHTLGTVSCGYPVKVIGVGGNSILYSWEETFTPTTSTYQIHRSGKITGNLQWQAYDSTLSAYYISNRDDNSTTGWVQNESVNVYADGSNTSITVDSGGEFYTTIWVRTQSAVATFGADGTGYAIVSYDNTDYEEASLTIRQDGRPLSTVNANELPGMAHIASKYTDDAYFYKLENGFTNRRSVIDIALDAQAGSSDESDVYVDFVQKAKYRSIIGGFGEGVVDDTSARNYVITQQSMMFDIT